MTEISEKRGENGIFFPEATGVEAFECGFLLERTKSGLIDVTAMLPNEIQIYIGAYNPKKRVWTLYHKKLAEWLGVNEFIETHELIFTEEERKNDRRRN